MNNLKLLDDSPAGDGETKYDAFNHSLYADLLRDVLLSNRPNICIGFFARWGQGKSTVINLLANRVGYGARLVVFNAYQARGDSIRRQMLLTILRQIDSSKADSFERFNQTITPFEFASSDQRSERKGEKIYKILLREKKLDPVLIGAAVAAIIFAAILVIRGVSVAFGPATYAESGDLIAWLAGSFFSCVAFLARKVSERADRILAYTQPVSDSQRLKYPEQFSKVFANSVSDFCDKTGKRLVIVVDDLDRCEPGTVVEALASVRQFCHRANTPPLDCQFLIPCDEAQMIMALEADGYTTTASRSRYHDYTNSEMLRKFFDVTLRMDELVPESLADFAAVQAKLIGIDSNLARDAVDACGLREPRKVKSLLNALRMAQEAVARNQHEGFLPESKNLERLDNTLAVLVCYQELVPEVFARIRDDIESLSTLDSDLNSPNDILARRILNGLGPISISTADVLITKQNETSLLGLPAAHTLPAAHREGKIEDVVEILKSATDIEREQLVRWLIQKLRDAKSSAKVRLLMSYCLTFGDTEGWNSASLRMFFADLKRQKTYLRDALRLGEKLQVLTRYCTTLSDAERAFFDSAILHNYLGAPDLHLNEQRFLLRFANALSAGDANTFRTALNGSLYHATHLDILRASHVSDALAEEPKRCFGFAPELGERVINSLHVDPIAPENRQLCAFIGMRLIGADRAVAGRILESVFIARSVLGAHQPITSEYLKTAGVYFDLLRGLLEVHRELPRFTSYLRDSYWPWFSRQRTAAERLKAIATIQPSWGILEHSDLARLSALLVPWIWGDDEFSRNIISTLEASQWDNSWESGRDRLRTSLFEQFVAVANGHADLSQPAKTFLSSVQMAKWPISNQAEALLAHKAKCLNPNFGGRPNNIEDWRVALQPLCNPEMPGIQAAIVDALANNAQPAELIMFATRTAWVKEIPQEAVSALAETLLKNPAIIANQNQTDPGVMNLPGFHEVIRVILKHLPAQGASWMFSQSLFMKNVANFTADDEELTRRLQESIDILLTSNRPEWIASGVGLLERHERISSDVQKSLAALSKRLPPDEGLGKKVTELSQRKVF